MNARLYDPLTGRFLSADSQIGGPSDNALSYNRYAYALGNPVKYTDPDGHFAFTIFAIGAALFTAGALMDDTPLGKALMVVGSVMMSASIGMPDSTGASLSLGAQTVSHGALAFGTNYAMTGDFNSAFKSGVTAMVSKGFNSKINNIDSPWYNKAFAHGTVQGYIAELLGGDFRDGFTVAFVASVASSWYQETSKEYNPSGRPHLLQEGKSNVGEELRPEQLDLIKQGKMKIPWSSDQSYFMKTLGRKGPFMDAFAEFHDGHLDWLVDNGVPTGFANIPTMFYSYPVTVVAYLQPYTTHLYLLDQYSTKERKENKY